MSISIKTQHDIIVSNYSLSANLHQPNKLTAILIKAQHDKLKT